MKKLRLTLGELTWVYYEVTLDRSEYDNFLDWFRARFTDTERFSFDQEAVQTMLNTSYEDALDIITGEKDDICAKNLKHSESWHNLSFYDELYDWISNEAYDLGVNDYGDTVDNYSNVEIVDEEE